jgi:hypothetical protein
LRTISLAWKKQLKIVAAVQSEIAADDFVNRLSIECLVAQMAIPVPDGAAERILCLFGTWAVVL